MQYNSREKNVSNRVLCGDLPLHTGKRVKISGWIHRINNLGGIEFFILRDRSGMTQLVVESGADSPDEIIPESVVEVLGTVTEEERIVPE